MEYCFHLPAGTSMRVAPVWTRECGWQTLDIVGAVSLQLLSSFGQVLPALFPVTSKGGYVRWFHGASRSERRFS